MACSPTTAASARTATAAAPHARVPRRPSARAAPPLRRSAPMAAASPPARQPPLPPTTSAPPVTPLAPSVLAAAHRAAQAAPRVCRTSSAAPAPARPATSRQPTRALRLTSARRRRTTIATTTRSVRTRRALTCARARKAILATASLAPITTNAQAERANAIRS
eukprot:4559877-Pleurochrysis_carterae.AAC.10